MSLVRDEVEKKPSGNSRVCVVCIVHVYEKRGAKVDLNERTVEVASARNQLERIPEAPDDGGLAGPVEAIILRGQNCQASATVASGCREVVKWPGRPL